MRKAILVLLIAALLVSLVPTASLARDRGYSGHRGNYYGNHDRVGYNHGGHNSGNFWLGLGVGIIGGAVIDTIARAPYYYAPPAYTASPDCRRVIVVDRYGYPVREYNECYPTRRW